MNIFSKYFTPQHSEMNRMKYKDYERLVTITMVVAAFASLAYFISDCELYGRFSYETFVPRFFILVPTIAYIWILWKVKDNKIKLFASHVIAHCTGLCTMWSVYNLENRTYASTGYMVIQIVILFVGFASPYFVCVLSHFVFLMEIFISNIFIHYTDLDVIMQLQLPLVLGLAIAEYVLSVSYREKYQAKAALDELYCKDQLTGAYNRHKLQEMVTESGKLDINRDISFIILDIDHFKSVNDTYGHDAGDDILKMVSRTIARHIRQNDLLIRWGGEEFVIMLFGCCENDAESIAESLRIAVATSDAEICPITISLGVAAYDGEHYKDTIRKADKALYYSKHNGRNKTTTYSKLQKIVND